jgi:hypothetical protein
MQILAIVEDAEVRGAEDLAIRAARNRFGTKQILNETNGRHSVVWQKAKASAGHRAKVAEITRRKWQDPEFRARTSAILKERCSSPEFRAKQSEMMKALWQDPELRARYSEANRAKALILWQDPEFRQRKAEASKEQMSVLWQDPEFRAAQSEMSKALWQDSEFVALVTPKLAEATRAQWKNSEWRAKVAAGICPKCDRPRASNPDCRACESRRIRRERDRAKLRARAVPDLEDE